MILNSHSLSYYVSPMYFEGFHCVQKEQQIVFLNHKAFYCFQDSGIIILQEFSKVTDNGVRISASRSSEINHSLKGAYCGIAMFPS